MAESIFPSTLLPQSNDPIEIQKGLLDLLAKINQVANDITAAQAASSDNTLGLMPIGGMIEYAGSVAPSSNWAICDGSAISRATYSVLFSRIGTAWGTGDGSTTFNLPDMRESAPVGAGTFTLAGGSTHSSIAFHDVFSLAQFKDDQMFSHKHPSTLDSFNPWIQIGLNVAAGAAIGLAASSAFSIGSQTNDGTGVPRAGNVTRGKRIGINFIIRIK